MENGEYLWKIHTFWCLDVGLFVVVAIDYITPNETVVEMQRIVANILRQLVKIAFVAMNVAYKDYV